MYAPAPILMAGQKWIGEQILRDVGKVDAQMAVVLLRYFNPIGAHESGLIGEDPQRNS